jgi:hypothetical protein
MYTESDLFFPNSSIQNLRDLRGEVWQQLIDRLTPLPDEHEETIAFILMVAQLNKCFVCQTDSFRAMRGCLICLAQTLKRFSGTDEMLVEMYDCALESIRTFADQPSPIAEMILRTEIVHLRS